MKQAIKAKQGNQGKKQVVKSKSSSSFSVRTTRPPFDSKANIGLTEKDCICDTMHPHCPVHSAIRAVPPPGSDVIR